MRNFRKYEVWQDSIGLVKKVYEYTADFPKNEIFGLVSQMRRAAVSIASNIAEGCSRNSEMEFKRFLEIAIGSAFELETQLLICSELKITKQNQEIAEILISIEKKINSLITKIKTEL